MTNFKEAVAIILLTAGAGLAAGFFIGITARVAAYVINF
jgi:hypothetical protein